MQSGFLLFIQEAIFVGNLCINQMTKLGVRVYDRNLSAVSDGPFCPFHAVCELGEVCQNVSI